MKKKKIIKVFVLLMFSLIFMSPNVLAKESSEKSFDYIVNSGDSLWKICVRHQVGISELLALNPQISDPNLIYPKQKLKIPDLSEVKLLENEVITIVNNERSKNGLKPLSHNWQLSRVARYKSKDMIEKNYFSHVSPVYGSPSNMMKNFGISFRASGENIAYGQRTPKEVMETWMNSSGHRQNILSSNYSQIGVGVTIAPNGQIYWTQMFIGW